MRYVQVRDEKQEVGLLKIFAYLPSAEKESGFRIAITGFRNRDYEIT